jgi:hypothetical protein
MPEPFTSDLQIFWYLALTFMVLSVPAYVVLQIYMPLEYQGRWRKLALWPLRGTVPLFSFALFALLTGHKEASLNMLLVVCAVAFLFLLEVWQAYQREP